MATSTFVFPGTYCYCNEKTDFGSRPVHLRRVSVRFGYRTFPGSHFRTLAPAVGYFLLDDTVSMRTKAGVKVQCHRQIENKGGIEL